MADDVTALALALHDERAARRARARDVSAGRGYELIFGMLAA